MRREKPKRSVRSIAKALKMSHDVVRHELIRAGLQTPRAPYDRGGDEAPAWYLEPDGRIKALRRAHGIHVPVARD
jgi:hypothetical protein